MAKSKYCYVLADSENRSMLLEDGKLPIYWNKRVAKERCSNFKGYVVRKLFLSDIEGMVLNSKKA